MPVSGAVIVTTPQEIALLDARKGDFLGALTITAPETGTRCENVNWMPPVLPLCVHRSTA